jgi:hypothetical protein
VDAITFAFSASPHQKAHADALARGFAAHGVTVKTGYPATKHVACWGWRQGKPLRERGHEVLVLERGYIGDRFAWTSLAWNGLNNRGTVPRIPLDGGERFDRHHAGLLKPWNPQGEYVLVIGQVPGDAALQGRDLSGWYAEQAAKDWGLPVYFRPHPLAHRRGPVRPVPGAPFKNGPLPDALQGAAWVVTFNSNTGVESYLAGKPTHVDDEGSMAWGVTNREQWAHRLAWRQWTMDEIASGVAWEHVRG